MTRRLALVLLPFVLALGACGDDSEPKPSAEGATTTAKADAAGDQELADAVVLKLSDLPSGYTEDEAEPEEPEEEGNPVNDCLAEEGKEVDEATTAEGESPDFSRGETTTVSSLSAVFETEADAEKAMDLLAGDKLKDCMDQALTEEIQAGGGEGIEIGDVTIKNASFPDVAEESRALQFSMSISAAGTELAFYVDMVFFRQDRVMGGLMLLNLGEPFPSSEAVDLAGKMSARMKAA